jgi:hypothetical protein
MSVFMLCERALGLVRGKRLELSAADRNRLEALDYEGLADAGAQEEALSCARHFAGVRDGILETYPWTFARRSEALQAAGGSVPGWRFSYYVPDDCARLLALVRPHGTSVPYDFADQRIACNAHGVIAKFTKKINDTEKWPGLFADAFCARLAHELSMSVYGEQGAPGAPGLLLQSFQFFVSEGYRTGVIDGGFGVDDRFAGATWNSKKHVFPSPGLPAAPGEPAEPA